MPSELRTWHEAFCQHCLVMKRQSPYTVRGYRDTLNSFVKYTGAATLADVTLAKVESWIMTGTTQHQWSPVTSRGRIKYMILFAKWLVSRGHLELNPLEGISLPSIPKKIPRSLSREQAEQLLRFARNFPFQTEFEGARAYAILATFIYTGIRKRELRELELRDVDLENGILAVREGKGAKDRMVAIPPQLALVLREYLKHRRSPRFQQLPYFFVGATALGGVGNEAIRRLVKKLRDASGIYFAPHMLRHTYATLMLEGGCDLFSLSKLLGHADIKTTTVYLSASVRHLQKEVLKHPVSI
jgi:site-specific recombinase XerD